MAERCFGCMQMKQMHPVCEHCGYDERTQNSDHQLPTGTVLGGQYLIGKALGQGGFGITYLAWDQVMNQPVAVKEYFPKGYASRTVGNTKVTSYDGQNAHDFEFNKKRFLREAESLAKLWDIPHIVKILRYFEENGTAYIVMEYVQGTNLRDYVKAKGRPLVMEEILLLLKPVVYALSVVHEISLVHRDIAPDNIMILPNGSAKLLDFGAARYVENANAEKERQSSTQQILKHGFAPPEQYSAHGALGPWTDVHALCGTIYYCLTGKVPPDALDRGYGGAVISWDHIPGLTPEQKSALEKGMALQPKDRFSSVGELWKQLKPVVPQPKPIPKPASRPEPEPEPDSPKMHWKKLIAIASAVLVVIGAAVFLGRRDKQTSDSPMETMDVSVRETDVTETMPQISEVVFTYEENEDGWTITGFEGDKENLPEIVVMPREKNGKPVTAIAGYAFNGCSSLTNVTIPDSVTSIGHGAFSGCSGLMSVTIPDSVSFIGNYVFRGCSRLTSVTIPDGVTSIYGGFFDGCNSLTSVTIPDSVASIGGIAFRGCRSLTSVTIPDSVTSIGAYAFAGCSNLTSVTIPGNVTSTGEHVFEGCSSLASVNILDNVTIINEYTFSDCGSLTSVTIPDSVTIISSWAFRDCTSLRSVTISEDCSFYMNSFPDTCIVNRRPSSIPKPVRDE